MRILLLLLFFWIFDSVPIGKAGDGDDDDYVPPAKKLKSSCFFSTPRFSPLERFPRDSHHQVSVICEGQLHSMAEMAENFDGKLFGAPHELALTSGRSGIFLDEYSDLVPFDDEVICDRHREELSRGFFNNKFGHVKKMRGANGKEDACGYPEEHSAIGKFSMSYQMSKNLLLSDNILVPAGTPLCNRHYRSIPKKPTSPRCSPFDISQPNSQNFPQNDGSEGVPSSQCSQASQESLNSEDDDSCYEGENEEVEVDPRSEMKSSLDQFFKKAGIKRAWCRKPLDERTPKNLRSKGHTVLEIMQTIVGLMANSVDEYFQLMAVVHELLAGKSANEENAILESIMTAVSENFNQMVKYGEKIQLLSIFAYNVEYRHMVKYIPNLARRMWKEAQVKAMSPKKTEPDVKRRDRYDPVKIDLFISFITSPHVVVGLPWGNQKTKDSLGNIINLPNTIRLTGLFETIEMYETWSRQSGREPLSNSTTYKILSRFPFSSKFFQDAFITIQGILKELVTLNLLTPDEATAYKRIFDEIQVYLRTDFKMHVKEESRIADHCMIHSLSDPNDARFSAPPRTAHDHDHQCPMCEKGDFVFRELGKKLADWAASPGPDPDVETKLLEAELDFRTAFDKIMDYKAHIVRSVFTSNEREVFIRELKEGEAFITMDFVTKWLAGYYRETQKDFFGKPGYSWHISHVYANVSGELIQHVFTHIIKNEIQNGSIVVEMIKHMAADLKAMGIHTINLRSDNAGYYHSASVMATISTIMQSTGVKIASWSFSEAQSGKSSADRYAAYCKTIMRNYMAKGTNIENHEEMFIALTSGKGLRGMSVHLMTVEVAPQPKTTLEGISKLGHFEFQGNTINAWRFRGIGKGMSKTGLKGIDSSTIFHRHGGKLSRPGLEMEDKQKIKNGEEPHYWFFPNKKVTTPEPDDVDDESVTGQAPPPADANSPKSLFVCPQCSSTFIRHDRLLRHLDNGRHKIRPEKVSMYDFALGTFKRMLEEVQRGVGIGPIDESYKEYQEAPKNPRPMGWALRSTKKGAKYNPVAKQMVDDLFEQYFRNNKKLRPDEAEKRMRDRTDISPSQRMTFDQIKNRITTLLAKKREEQKKVHNNRQRRRVAFITDWENELIAEGIALDDIEEEVDLNMEFDDNDLIITSDAIYDLVHDNMDFFEEPSNPVFSDFGEFEQ